MSTRQEILRRARELAQAVAESQELEELQRCEAAIEQAGGAGSLLDGDPRAIAYESAKQSAERLLRQVMSVFLFPLTGSVQSTSDAPQGCAGCVR